jgi:DNA-binding transcriptional regulator YiaG
MLTLRQRKVTAHSRACQLRSTHFDCTNVLRKFAQVPAGCSYFPNCRRVVAMANIAAILKEEITRLARKELKASTESLKKAVTTYRSEIAALKRRIETLERQAKKTAKVVGKVQPQEAPESDGSHRWSAKGFATHRQRLGLSAANYGRLLGVSGLSVYKWEGGAVRPRAKYLSGIASIRQLGKREALARLEQLA